MLKWLGRGKGLEAARRRLERGAALERAGRLADACRAYRSAIDAAPAHVPAHLHLGVALEALGLAGEAERAYRAALLVEPGNPFAAFNLGKLALVRAQLPEAKSLLEAALRAKPDFADAHVVLAAVHEADGDAASALASLEAALRSRPGYGGALRNRGLLLARLGRWPQAEAALREAVAADPADADARYWLGRSLHYLGRPAEAERALREALDLRPEDAEILVHLGNVLCDLGRPGEARTHLERAATLAPSLAEAHAGLGAAYAAEKMPSEALGSLRRALELDPRLLHAHLNLANLLAARGEDAEARAHYDAALALDPGNVEARWCRAMAAIPVLRDAPEELERSRAAFAAELAALDGWFDATRAALGHRVVGLRQPFWLAYQEARNTDLLRVYGRLCARLMSAWPRAPTTAAARTRPPGRVRVGIVSQYFRDHSVWNAIVKGWFLHLDRTRIELAAFCLGGEDDTETRVARANAARFEQGPRTLEQWVDAIGDWRPDVLIYPEVGMDPMTTRLASLRLAPRQAASWGHPETTGLPTIDAFLSAQGLEPDGARSNYTEALVELPHLGCCVEPQGGEAAFRLADAALDRSVPLLVCPGTPYKYAPEHDVLLARIARELGDCRLVFFDAWSHGLTARLRARLARAFERENLAPDRFLRLLPWLPRPAFLGLMRQAHALLDTVGFSGFNTAIQALQCDLPVVAYEGRFLRGRLASGVLRRMGLDELVAQSADDYVAQAVRVVRDHAYRDALRARIPASRAALFGDLAPVRALEDFVRGA